MTLGGDTWTVVCQNGDVFEDVTTIIADTVAFEAYCKATKRGAVRDSAMDGQVYTIWRALRRMGKIPPDSRYETWRETEVAYLVKDDGDQADEEDGPGTPTGPGPTPG